MAIGELEGVLQKGTSGHRLGKFDFVIYILQVCIYKWQAILTACTIEPFSADTIATITMDRPPFLAEV